ncbi:AAA-type ATPase lid domain-containing protein, partial [Acidithiobacillus ferriphilus]
YRLNIYPIELPPLRERTSDIPLLVNYFSNRLCSKGYPSLTITDAALDILMRYFWPGNVRELQNLVERLAVQRLNGHSGQIAPEDLPSYLCHPLVDSLRTDYADNPCSDRLTPVEKLGFSVLQPKFSGDNFSLPDTLRQIERTYIEQAMQRANGNMSEAARLLGVPRTT